MNREQRLNYRAETERLRMLTEFLSRPVQCAGGKTNADPDVVSAYNNATETALKAVRQIAIGSASCSTNLPSSSPSGLQKDSDASEPQGAPSGQNSTV